MRIDSPVVRCGVLTGLLVVGTAAAIAEAQTVSPRTRGSRVAQQTSPDRTPVERERGAAADRTDQEEPVRYNRAIVRIAQDYTVARHVMVAH